MRERPRYSRLLSWHVTYGVHLHGESGTVDRDHNQPGGRFVDADSLRATKERLQMDHAAYSFDRLEREVVLQAIQDVCLHRTWDLIAAHVRTNHVHAIVEAEAPPERIMNAFKSWASRRLNERGVGETKPNRWTRHESTRWLWKDQDVLDAIRYVVDEQGEPMAVFVSDG